MLFHTSKTVNSRGFGNLLTSRYLISTMLDLPNFDQQEFLAKGYNL